MRTGFRLAITFGMLLCSATGFAQSGDRRLARPASPGSERRVALVVGNNAYTAAPLKNAVADARTIGATLRDLGFTVTLLENATRTALTRAVAQMSETLAADDVAFFFFAGHGVQVGGENYLIPVDFTATTATAAQFDALAASQLQQVFAKARVSLLVLDACRNNPFSGQRAGGGGLAPMEARGSLVAFATGAGQTASDNIGAQNGLFTQELLQVLKEPNLNARDVFYRVRQRVYEASRGQQFPAVYDGLIGDFVFRPGSVRVPQGTPASSPSAPADDLALKAELVLWDEVKDGRSAKGLEEYLRQYPTGRFRVIAEERLAALRAPAAPAPAPPPPARVASARARGPLVVDTDNESLAQLLEKRTGTLRAAGFDPEVRRLSAFQRPPAVSGPWAAVTARSPRRGQSQCDAVLDLGVKRTSSSPTLRLAASGSGKTCEEATALAADKAVSEMVRWLSN